MKCRCWQGPKKSSRFFSGCFGRHNEVLRSFLDGYVDPERTSYDSSVLLEEGRTMTYLDQKNNRLQSLGIFVFLLSRRLVFGIERSFCLTRFLCILSVTFFLFLNFDFGEQTILGSSTLNPSISKRSFFQQQQKKSSRIKELEEVIAKAQEHYKSKQFEESGDSIRDAVGKILVIAKGTEGHEVEDLKKHIRRVRKAISLLKKKNQKIQFGPISIKKKEEPKKKEANSGGANPMSPKMKPNTISFSRQVAPILSNRCGNCHIRRASGGVRFQRFAQLESQIEIGDAESSNLFDVVSSGQMPPGNNKIPGQELEVIRKWIDQGAKFDGKDLQADISQTAKIGSLEALDVRGLTNKRKDDGLKTIKLALPGQDFQVVQFPRYQAFVAGSLKKSQWEPFLKDLEKQMENAFKSIGKIPESNQIAKAKPLVFVIGDFYDFTEVYRVILKKPVDSKAKFVFGNLESGPFVAIRSVPKLVWQKENNSMIASSLAVATLQLNVPSWLRDSLGNSLKAKSKKPKNDTEQTLPTQFQPQEMKSWIENGLSGTKKIALDRYCGSGWAALTKQKRKVLRQLASGVGGNDAVESTFKAPLATVVKKLVLKGISKR